MHNSHAHELIVAASTRAEVRCVWKLGIVNGFGYHSDRLFHEESRNGWRTKEVEKHVPLLRDTFYLNKKIRFRFQDLHLHYN
jgi:hypothetical protein